MLYKIFIIITLHILYIDYENKTHSFIKLCHCYIKKKKKHKHKIFFKLYKLLVNLQLHKNKF